MSELPEVKVVEISPTRIWIESDILGARHVVAQHQGAEPFTVVSIHYNYRYTSNAGTLRLAKDLALQFGATEPVEERMRPFQFPDQALP